MSSFWKLLSCYRVSAAHQGYFGVSEICVGEGHCVRLTTGYQSWLLGC